jgi:hypothetical protein
MKSATLDSTSQLLVQHARDERQIVEASVYERLRCRQVKANVPDVNMLARDDARAFLSTL